MPIFTTNVGQQNQAGSAGINSFPSISMLRQFGIVMDEFARETVQPTNAYTLYTTSNGQGTGTSSIINLNQLQVATTAVLNDNTDFRTSGLTFSRILLAGTNLPNSFDSRSILNHDTILQVNGILTNVKIFIGLINAQALTALPTTAIHMGMYVDTSISNNWKLSSSNGTTQVTTDSGDAVSANARWLNINWTGNDAAVITLYDNTNAVLKTQTVSALLAGSTVNLEWHVWIQTVNAGAKTVAITGWKASAL